jgi:hypothetical protein
MAKVKVYRCKSKKQPTNVINLYFPLLLCINDRANKKTGPNKILISDFYILYEPRGHKWNLYIK